MQLRLFRRKNPRALCAGVWEERVIRSGVGRLRGLDGLALAFDEDHSAAERAFENDGLAFAQDVRDGGVLAAEGHHGAGHRFHLAAAAAFLDGRAGHLAVAHVGGGITLLDRCRRDSSDEGLGLGHGSSGLPNIFSIHLGSFNIVFPDEGRRS